MFSNCLFVATCEHLWATRAAHKNLFPILAHARINDFYFRILIGDRSPGPPREYLRVDGMDTHAFVIKSAEQIFILLRIVADSGCTAVVVIIASTKIYILDSNGDKRSLIAVEGEPKSSLRRNTHKANKMAIFSSDLRCITLLMPS